VCRIVNSVSHQKCIITRYSPVTMEKLTDFFVHLDLLRDFLEAQNLFLTLPKMVSLLQPDKSPVFLLDSGSALVC